MTFFPIKFSALFPLWSSRRPVNSEKNRPRCALTFSATATVLSFIFQALQLITKNKFNYIGKLWKWSFLWVYFNGKPFPLFLIMWHPQWLIITRNKLNKQLIILWRNYHQNMKMLINNSDQSLSALRHSSHKKMKMNKNRRKKYCVRIFVHF